MAIDRYDWHYDSAAEAYRERNGITGELTEEQEEEICLYAADHIGLFLRWVIENGFEGKGEDEEIDEIVQKGCEKVRNGEITGAEYLMNYCDGKFWDCDICDEIKPFVEEYYNSDDKNRPYQYFIDLVAAIGEENIYQIISGDTEYNALKPLIDRAYKAITKQEN